MTLESFAPLFYRFRVDAAAFSAPNGAPIPCRVIEVREVLTSKLADWTHAVLDIAGQERESEAFLLEQARGYGVSRYGATAFDLLDEFSLTPNTKSRFAAGGR